MVTKVQKLLLLHDSYLRVPKRGVLLVAQDCFCMAFILIKLVTLTNQ